MIPRQNLSLPTGRDEFLRLAWSQLLQPKKVNFSYMQPLYFLSMHPLLPVKEKHWQLSKSLLSLKKKIVQCWKNLVARNPECLGSATRQKLTGAIVPWFNRHFLKHKNILYHWISPRRSMHRKDLANKPVKISQSRKQSHVFWNEPADFPLVWTSELIRQTETCHNWSYIFSRELGPLHKQHAVCRKV